MHTWLPEAICKSVGMWVSLLVCTGMCLICVYLIRDLGCTFSATVLEERDWPFSWTIRLWWALNWIMSVENREAYFPSLEKRWKITMSLEENVFFFFPRVCAGLRWLMQDLDSKGLFCSGKMWDLRCTGRFKTSKGFEWFLCSLPSLDSRQEDRLLGLLRLSMALQSPT